MELLNPVSNQERPTFTQARAMCQQVPLEIRSLMNPRFDSVMNRLRETHANGGALFASFNVGPNQAFDWFASRNLLLQFGILRQLLDRVEVTSALPELQIEPAKADDPAFAVRKLEEVVTTEQLAEILKFDNLGNEPGRLRLDQDYEIGDFAFDGNFRVTSSFLFDGELADELYAGGAYTSTHGNGRAEKENSLAFCEALFGLRFSEMCYYSSRNDWTPWFQNVTGDWTAILFDRRSRALSILATTDSD
jgi:hypothetical protein